MKKHFSIVVILVAVASGACLAQSASPSLADVARETREEKKTAKVFTDEDLPARSSSASSVQPAADGAATGSAKNADAQPASTAANSNKAEVKKTDSSAAKGEGTAAELKKKIDHYTEERDAWKKSVKRYEDLLQNETSEFRRQTYQDALDVDRQNVELYQQKIDDMQSQLAKAHQESAPSGKEPDNQTAATGHP